jgi:hypothetical protein
VYEIELNNLEWLEMIDSPLKTRDGQQHGSIAAANV